jgi:hypothetical protein
MARHVWTVLCRRAVVDRFSNAASAFDMLEEIVFEPQEALVLNDWMSIPIEATLISFIIRSDQSVAERPGLRVEVISPTGERYKSVGSVELDLVGSSRIRNLFTFPAVPFREFGIQKFIIHLEETPGDWKQVAEIPLEFKLKQAPVEEKAGSNETRRKSVSKKPS